MRARPASNEVNGTRPGRRAMLAALALAFLSLCAAVIAARGPAIDERASYAWPPRSLPDAAPSRTWFAPLLLARHYADALSATVPCGAAPALSSGDDSVVLLATTRNRKRWNGLEILRSEQSRDIVVRVGGDRLARLRLSAGTDCTLSVAFSRHNWSIRMSGGRERTGRVDTPPYVHGLLTELDLRKTDDVRVVVRPLAADTRSTTAQIVARVVAALLLVLAIGLTIVPVKRRAHRWRVSSFAPQDAVVIITLATWWLLAPLQDDDGWVRARQANSVVSGGFSNYYEHWGANLPLATWYEWLQQFIVTNTDGLAVHRLPSVAALGATWILCRTALAFLLNSAPSGRSVAWWCAALSFAAGAVAFGMSLRPEPMIALLATVSLLCCVRYAVEPSLQPLVIAVLAASLAVTVHPAGLVAAAPLVVCARQLVRDARGGGPLRVSSLVLLLFIGAAATTLLSFLDFDLESRQRNIDLISAGGHNYGILSEYLRYDRLSASGGSPLRREFVALAVLCVVGLFAVRRPPRTLATRLPSASVFIGLLALTLTPSKWIWHFGTLVGVVCVGVGLEIHRLKSAELPRRARWLPPIAVTAAGLWAVGGGVSWGPFDLMRLNWRDVPQGEIVLGVAAAIMTLAAISRRGRGLSPDVPVLPATLGVMLVVATSTFALDAVITNGWTASRQAASSLVGRDACGIASDLVVPDPDTMEPLRSTTSPGIPLAERRQVALTQTPEWFRLTRDPVGVFVAARWTVGSGVRVTWGRQTARGIRSLASGLADTRQASAGLVLSERRFVSQSSFPERPRTADVIRLRLERGGDQAARIWPPVAYRTRGVADFVTSARIRELVSPFLYEAVPCAATPALALGVAEAPNLLIDWSFDSWTPLGNYTSPFVGVPDMLDVSRLPIERWKDGRSDIQIHWIEPDERDALVPPTRTID